MASAGSSSGGTTIGRNSKRRQLGTTTLYGLAPSDSDESVNSPLEIVVISSNNDDDDAMGVEAGASGAKDKVAAMTQADPNAVLVVATEAEVVVAAEVGPDVASAAAAEIEPKDEEEDEEDDKEESVSSKDEETDEEDEEDDKEESVSSEDEETDEEALKIGRRFALRDEHGNTSSEDSGLSEDSGDDYGDDDDGWFD